jgi:hypothetical protein
VRARSASTRVSLLLVFAFAFTLLGASTAFGISRDAVLARAQRWIDTPVAYSQKKYFSSYRTDCSGYVSMCWETGRSWTTATFHAVATKIKVANLKPGDAMLRPGSHIRLFYGWVDDTHTTYIAYEQTGPTTKSSVKSIAADVAYGYRAYRYDHISDSPEPRNLLWNSTFDVWTSTWTVPNGAPLWWGADGSGSEPVVEHRQDAVRSARNALEIVNPSANTGTRADMSQVATIAPNTLYQVSAWARTAANPSHVDLRLEYLDATGASIACTRTVGGPWGVNGSSFTKMSALMTSPPNAVQARVIVRVCGGTTPSGTVDVDGTTALLDDVALVRPLEKISIKTSATTARITKSVTLSGSVTPVSTIGRTIRLYVQKPGCGWTGVPSPVIRASGAGAAWKYTYTFKRGAHTGLYRFKASIPAYYGWLAATAPATVSVRVK